jgi:hypothetical protein
MAKTNLALTIKNHPDFEEILCKLIENAEIKDIHEWLAAKYDVVSEKQFIISIKNLKSFKDNYLDFYTAIREDVVKTKHNISAREELKLEIQGTPAYHNALEKYATAEMDIKLIAKRLAAALEVRLSQVFDLIQEDPRNIKMDRTLIEWFNTFFQYVKDFDAIQNGTPDQINIQNNINIQVIDDHINVIYEIIKEILSKLDYDTSLEFINMFNERMQKVKAPTIDVLPVATRMEEAKLIESSIITKLD